MFMKTAIASIAMVALLAGPAAAQKNVNAAGGKGLVVVAINALNPDQLEILNDANIEVLNGTTIQVPLQVAATVCELEVNAIASSNDKGNKTCTATADGIQALAQ